MIKSEEFRLYCRLLANLHREMRSGQEDKAEITRTQMDEPHKAMTLDECRIANRLSAKLWAIQVAEIDSVVDQYLAADHT